MSNEEFFNLVKGKKLAWHEWDVGQYCIPVELTNECDMFLAKTYMPFIIEGSINSWYIGDGFGLNGWLLIDENEQQTKQKCTCSTSDLMIQGCTCGGI